MRVYRAFNSGVYYCDFEPRPGGIWIERLAFVEGHPKPGPSTPAFREISETWGEKWAVRALIVGVRHAEYSDLDYSTAIVALVLNPEAANEYPGGSGYSRRQARELKAEGST